MSETEIQPRRGQRGHLGTICDQAARDEDRAAGFARRVRDESWQSHQHEFGSAGGTELGTGSGLMRLAAGGSAG